MMFNSDFSSDSSKDKIKDKIASSVGDAKDNISAAASDLTTKSAATLDDAKANVGAAVSDLSAKSSATLHGAKASVKGNPIGLIIGGVVVGAAVAAFLPVTDAERRRVQPVRDDLVGRAVKAKDDVVRAGRGVLEETVSAASQAVNKHSNELAKELEDDFKTTDPKPGEAKFGEAKYGEAKFGDPKNTVGRAADTTQNAANRTADNLKNAVDKTASDLKN